jgi:electron transfer flavoprotein alpha subunit
MNTAEAMSSRYANDYQGVWVFAEQRGGRLLEVGLEILSEARKLADRLQTEVSALLLGKDVSTQAGELIARGADRVFLADHPSLKHFNPDSYSTIVVDLVNEYRPAILLLGATSVGRDLAPTVAARLDTGLCADCIAFDLDEQNRLLQIAPVFGGKELAHMLCPVRRPQMATVRPSVFVSERRKSARAK